MVKYAFPISDYTQGQFKEGMLSHVGIIYLIYYLDPKQNSTHCQQPTNSGKLEKPWSGDRDSVSKLWLTFPVEVGTSTGRRLAVAFRTMQNILA